MRNDLLPFRLLISAHRSGLVLPPDRAWPADIAGPADNHMEVQLRHHIAKGRNVHLIGTKSRRHGF
jgi:hypothetical protein